MTFTIRVRGDVTGTRFADYRCEEHGTFDALVSRVDTPDTQPCPTCGAPSPWTIGAPLYKPQRGAVSQGKIAPPPDQRSLDTRALGEGKPFLEWKKERNKIHEADRRARVKRMLR